MLHQQMKVFLLLFHKKEQQALLQTAAARLSASACITPSV
jgi:hypothetical protein